MPIPILYLITELDTGGAQVALLRLLANLDRGRFSPTVACLYNGDGAVAQAIRALGIQVFDVGLRHKADLAALFRLYRWIVRVRPVILHTSLFHANLPGRILGRLAGVPIIVCSERTMAMESEWRYRLNRWTIGLVDRVIAVSVSVRDFCISHIGLPAGKLVVIPNGVELPEGSPIGMSRCTHRAPSPSRQESRARLSLPSDVRVIGAVSRLDPAKGLGFLIQALAGLDGVHLAIVGDGPERTKLGALADDLGVAGRVHWAGHRRDVSDLLPAFDLFVQPSLYEGLPNTVLEAMAAGLPVVATAVGGTPEVVMDGTTGLLVPPGDPGALSQAIARLLRDPALRRAMGQAGRERVTQHFTVACMVERTEALYRQLLDDADSRFSRPSPTTACSRRCACLRRRHYWAGLVFVLNLAFSLVFCFVISPHLMGSGLTLLDPDGYGGAGRNLYETGRFDSIEKAPLYPAFVALVSFLAGGYHIGAVQVAQCVLSALACILLYAIFRRTLGERVAQWAGLACALYPMLIWYTPRLWTETFLTFVLAGFVLTLVELLQRPAGWRGLLCGAMAAAVALSKGIGLVFVLLTPLVMVLCFRGRAWRWLPSFVLAAAMLIAPWTWRNWRLAGQFLPIHANGGYNFYLGNGFARHWVKAPLSYAALKAYTEQDIAEEYIRADECIRQAVHASSGVDPSADPVAADRVLLHAAWCELRAHPLLGLQKLAVQSLTFWYLAADAPKSLLTGALQFPIVLAALPGVMRALRRRSWAMALTVPVAGIMGASVTILAFARLSAIIMPYLIGLALYALWPASPQDPKGLGRPLGSQRCR